jgi:hypothetical protein
MLRIPHFLENRLTDGGEVFSLTHRPRFTRQENSWYSFLLVSQPQCLVLLEGLGKLKKFIYSIGPRTLDLPAFNIVP